MNSGHVDDTEKLQNIHSSVKFRSETFIIEKLITVQVEGQAHKLMERCCSYVTAHHWSLSLLRQLISFVTASARRWDVHPQHRIWVIKNQQETSEMGFLHYFGNNSLKHFLTNL